MTLLLTRRRALAAAASALAAAPLATLAQSWPARPIRWVVAYPAGGGSDFLARQLAPQLGKQLGQTLVIDNRPGAAGQLAVAALKAGAADGIFTEEEYKRMKRLLCLSAAALLGLASSALGGHLACVNCGIHCICPPEECPDCCPPCERRLHLCSCRQSEHAPRRSPR